MNKKKVTLIIIIVILIIIIILLLLRSCASQAKRVVTTEQEIYSAFINASVRFTCDTIDNPLLITEDHANQVYKNHRLPVEENEKMMEILKKYENDEEVLEIIQTNSMPCRTGQPPITFKHS
jgi:cell shape-determining protein MreC